MNTKSGESTRDQPKEPRKKYANSRPGNARNEYQHTDCKQAVYQRQSGSGRHGGKKYERTYSEVLREGNTNYGYSIPTKNFYNPLN